MKSQYVKELALGDSVESFFAVRKIDFSESSGTPRLALELGDKTGRINGVMWHDTKKTLQEIKVGDPVKIRGSVNTYHNKL